MEQEIKNAIIAKVFFSIEMGFLDAWLTLDYGDGTYQGFGGYALYSPIGFKAHKNQKNFAGHFIWRVLQVAEVDDFSKCVGKSVRAQIIGGKISGIGHIIKQDWFHPTAEFESL